MTSRTRLTATGFLVLTLTAGAARAVTANPQPHRTVRSESADIVLQVRDWLLSLVAPNPTAPDPNTSSIHENEGSQLDPNGQH
jgi:hypothetical protein